jgi:hypothetical protein
MKKASSNDEVLSKAPHLTLNYHCETCACRWSLVEEVTVIKMGSVKIRDLREEIQISGSLRPNRPTAKRATQMMTRTCGLRPPL